MRAHLKPPFVFMTAFYRHRWCNLLSAVAAALTMAAAGCGTTREQQATDQLVISDAVDRNIQRIDFRPLTRRKVYLDTSYLRHVKGAGFVNSEYVTSALRQQIVAAGCQIQDSAQEADIIIEARIARLAKMITASPSESPKTTRSRRRFR